MKIKYVIISCMLDTIKLDICIENITKHGTTYD